MTDSPAPDWPVSPLAGLYRWDEIEGYRLLAQHFDLIEGFAFVVVLAPDDEAISLLRNQLPQLLPERGAIVRIRFDSTDSPARLAESVLDCSPASEVRLIWIDADPVAPDQFAERDNQWAAALQTLNRYRNTLTAKFATTIALALPSRLLPTLRKSAPDLWSIRSGVFRIDPPGASQAGIFRLPPVEWQSWADGETGDAGDPAVTLAEAQKLRGKPGRENLLATLLQRAGNQAARRFDWNTASAALQEAYTLQVAAGADPDLRWQISIDLAKVLSDFAQYDRAVFYLNHALQTAEQFFGQNNPKTALSLNNLAMVLMEKNRLVDAEPLMQLALEIDQKFYGTEHPVVSVRLNNLSHLLEESDRLAEAEPLIRLSLAIDQRAFGDDHPNVALRLNNLAMLLKKMGRFEEAEPLARRALTIDVQSLGAEHPSVARDLSNLGSLLTETNRPAEAEPLIRRALEIDEHSYGATHPNVAIRLNNLALLLKGSNRLAEAEPHMRRAVEIFKSRLGQDHPFSKVVANNYRWLLEEMNQSPVEIEEKLRDVTP